MQKDTMGGGAFGEINRDERQIFWNDWRMVLDLGSSSGGLSEQGLDEMQH